MKTVEQLANSKSEKNAGNHKVRFSLGQRLFYYYSTVICKVNDAKKTFVIDSSYGTQSTTRACNAYRKHFESLGYTEQK